MFVDYFDRKILVMDGTTDISSQKTLVVGERNFIVDGAKLSKKSLYFEKMFCGNFREAQEDIIYIQGVDETAFECIVRWLNDDDLNLPPDEVVPIYDVVQYLLLRDELMEEFTCYIKCHIDEINAIELWRESAVYFDTQYYKFTWEYLLSNIDSYYDDIFFKELTFDEIHTVLKHSNLTVDYDNSLIWMIAGWLSHDVTRKKYLSTLLQLIVSPIVEFSEPMVTEWTMLNIGTTLETHLLGPRVVRRLSGWLTKNNDPLFVGYVNGWLRFFHFTGTLWSSPIAPHRCMLLVPNSRPQAARIKSDLFFTVETLSKNPTEFIHYNFHTYLLTKLRINPKHRIKGLWIVNDNLYAQVGNFMLQKYLIKENVWMRPHIFNGTIRFVVTDKENLYVYAAEKRNSSYSSLYIYYEETDEWKCLEGVPTAHNFHCGALVNNELYAGNCLQFAKFDFNLSCWVDFVTYPECRSCMKHMVYYRNNIMFVNVFNQSKVYNIKKKRWECFFEEEYFHALELVNCVEHLDY